MNVALDTNIVIRSVNNLDAFHGRVSDQLRQLIAGRNQLCVAPQTIFEFWAVVTRPIAANGLGLTPVEARAQIERLRKTFTILPDPAQLIERWLELCTRFAVKGRSSHDVRLVAWMDGNGLNKIVTLNTADFKRFPHIECVNPADPAT